MSTPPTLQAFCGKPGAGKRTLAARLAQADGAVLISEDVWMARLFGDQLRVFDDDIRCAPRLLAVVGPLAVDLLRLGQPVVLDVQANTRARRRWLRGVADEAGAALVLHLLQPPDSVCLARIAQRNRALPEGAHRLSEAVFHHVASYFEPPSDDEGVQVHLHD